MYWLGQKVCSGIPQGVTENPEGNFWSITHLIYDYNTVHSEHNLPLPAGETGAARHGCHVCSGCLLCGCVNTPRWALHVFPPNPIFVSFFWIPSLKVSKLKFWRILGPLFAEAPMFWPHDLKNWLIGKDPDAGRDWGQEEMGTTEDEVAGWHHWLDGHEFGLSPGDGDGQGGLACCDSWGCKDWATELNWTLYMSLNK